MSASRGTTVFALATFHASVFLVVPLLIAYRGGGLGQTLQGLNTFLGLALFVTLWTTTYVATRRALSGVALSARGPIDHGKLMEGAVRWGGLNGVMFFSVLQLALFSVTVMTRPDVALQSVLFLAGLLVVGGVAAFMIGAVVGAVFAGFDLILLGTAARLLPREAPPAA